MWSSMLKSFEVNLNQTPHPFFLMLPKYSTTTIAGMLGSVEHGQPEAPISRKGFVSLYSPTSIRSSHGLGIAAKILFSSAFGALSLLPITFPLSVHFTFTFLCSILRKCDNGASPGLLPTSSWLQQNSASSAQI